MKILHTADWHIGSFKGPENSGVNLRSQDTLNCINKLVEAAENEHPDFVLISGDIFHQAEVWQNRSHKEVLQARSAIVRLSNAAGQVIIMRGTPNHDSEAAFEELDAHFAFVPNVYVVTMPKLLKFDDVQIAAIPGFDRGTFRASHPGLSKEDENEAFTEEIRNLIMGLKAQCDDDKLSVLMAHATVPGCNMESGQTQFLKQFEPVIMPETLNAAEFDLVALGHIHRPQQMPNVKNCFYSGAINAMNFNDEGQERGFYLHEFQSGMLLSSRFIKTPYREFCTIELSDSDISKINAGAYEEVGAVKWWGGLVEDKIVRVLYSCTAENNKVFNKVRLEQELIKYGAFWVSGIEAAQIETANRTELSKQEDPEENLIQYLKEKQIPEERIGRIVEQARPIIARALADSAVSEFFGTFIPVEIEVRNYRNYAEQYFSFKDISFCTVNGPNGSGKSSIFMDAIVDCLYEEPREGTNTGWIRNDESAKSGSISFTFVLGEKTFRVVRTRTKSGKPTLNLSELIDGEWQDRSKEKLVDTQAEIERILGMDSMAFKACVLIMQDQYGLFLEADKEERVSVLSNLLGLGVYGVMENLTKDKLTELRRAIAKVNDTVTIHKTTIEQYGNPKDELIEREGILKTYSEKKADYTKRMEEKSLMLRMHKESIERRQRTEAGINELQKKIGNTQESIESLSATISECELKLSNEAEMLEKAERYGALAETERSLSEASVTYSLKAAEFYKLKDNECTIKAETADMDSAIKARRDEINNLMLESASDGDTKNKAAEFEQTKQLLEKAYEQEREYRAVEQELLALKNREDSLGSKYSSLISSLEEKKKGYEKQAELLKNVNCVDIQNAECGFLASAIEAKKLLLKLPEEFEKVNNDYNSELAPLEVEIKGIKDRLNGLNKPDDIPELQKRCAELKPYQDRLAEIGQREARIASLESEINLILSNKQSNEKQLSTLENSLVNLTSEMKSLEQKTDEHSRVKDEMEALLPFVEAVKGFPVLHERLENAKIQKATEAERLTGYTSELEASVKELADMPVSAVNESELTGEVEFIKEKLSAIDSEIADTQQQIGSLKHKIEEVDKLNAELKTLDEESAKLSADLSDYEILKVAFSQDGIPHQIIRSLIPKLTEVSSSILGQMTAGKMGIAFETEKVLKSNKNKEVVTLDILIEEYGKSTLPYLSKSGGEKVKASLSVILALAEIKSTVSGLRTGLLFIDEAPFLDQDGAQAYVDALEAIQVRYPDLKVMAISHDPVMKSRFAQSITVYKDETGSHVRWD